MSGIDVPEWCRWRGGRRPLVLVAPHGGRADTTAMRALDTKVNDVHTADLTWSLAEELDAAAIVNPVRDRNELDLNRISQITRGAPWFPQLIERVLAPLLDAHPMVELLFIHGWNVIQPKCDLGVGGHFATETDLTDGALLTTDPTYVRRRLATLRARCASAGIHTTYGERYPASHRNNVLQLFRRDGSRPCAIAPRIAEWAASGRLNAVQLELGVPLRWPGRLRDAFTRALIDTFAHGVTAEGGRGSRRAGDDKTAHLEIDPPRETRDAGGVSAAMLVAYDPRARIGFMTGVSTQANGQMGGRFLVFSEGQTMALFTGEDPTTRGTVVGGPRFQVRDGATDVSFAGPLLEVEDAAAYVRLEQAFRQSRLIDAAATLSFAPTLGPSYGRIRGALRLDGIEHHLDTFGFRDVPIFLRRPGLTGTRCAVAAAFGRDIGLHAATTAQHAMRWARHGSAGTHTTQMPTRIDETRASASHAPRQLALDCEQQRLLVTPLNHMHIHRPLPGGGAEMIFLGLARCELDARSRGYGFYEYVRPS